MGIYVGLSLIPQKISQEEWKKVFEETLQLIKAYPFATQNVENVNGFKRLVLDRTEEQFIEGYGSEEKYWKINGDLESKETGESFTLFSSLERYSDINENTVKEDILLCFAEDGGGRARNVFYSKTQGKNYHTFLLSIAALIESRFPKFACVYGDISKEQAQKAVEWANSLLEKPIDLPIRVNYSKLLERLDVINIEEKRIEALYELSIGANEEVDALLPQNFNVNAIQNYFAKHLRGFKRATQLGSELMIIRYLNTGLPLEILIDICCFDNNGPQFEPIEFSKAICSTWVFIEPEMRGFMEAAKRPVDEPDSVESQIGNMFSDLGYMGRRTRRYIPKEEVLLTLGAKFQDLSEIEEIVNKRYQEIVAMLKEKGKKLKRIEEEYQDELNQNTIVTLDGLLHWNNSHVISGRIIKTFATIKEGIEDSLKTRESLIQIIGEAEEQGLLIKALSQIIQEHQYLVLTRGAWDWIENESTDVIKQMVIMLLTFENNEGMRKLYRACFENKELFYKYIR